MTIQIGSRVKFGNVEGELVDVAGNHARIKMDDKRVLVIEVRGVEDFLVLVVPPMPTEPGLYVPANNRESLAHTFVYRLNGLGWNLFAFNREQQGAEAKKMAADAHRRLGGLVRLVAEE